MSIGGKDMRATASRDDFFEFQHQDGRLKLTERLAAAYDAGEVELFLIYRKFRFNVRAGRLPVPKICPQ